MDATTTTKSAAPSTPAAPPAASPAAESHPGADAGLSFSKSEMLAELGLSPEGQFEAPPLPADAAPADSAAHDPAAPAAGAEAAAPAGEASGAEAGAESEPLADAQNGETPADSGATDETTQPDEAAAEAQKEPEKSAIQQRIDELTAARKGAEEEAARLREQLATMQARQSGALEESVLSTVEDFPALQAQRDRMLLLHQWALENPDGGQMPDKEGKPVDYSREEVARIQSQTFRLLNRDIPQRAAYLQARAQADAVALQSYPWIKSVSAGWGQDVQQAVEQLPQLRTVPGYRLIAANAYVGEKLRSAGIRVDDALIARLRKEQAGEGKPAPRAVPPKAPAAPARPGTVPPRTAPKASLERSARQRLVETAGSIASIEDSIAAKLG